MGEVPGGSQEAPASLDTPLDKILDSVIDWSKRLETGELSAAAQNTVLSLDWRPPWGSGHQASGTPPLFLPEAQEDLNKADVLKKSHNINKVLPHVPLGNSPPTTPPSMARGSGCWGSGISFGG